MPNETEKALYDLIDFAQGRLSISFYRPGQTYEDTFYGTGKKTPSFAVKDPATAWKVKVGLFEAESGDYGEWLPTIQEAKRLLVEVRETLRAECFMPNMFNALVAQVRFKETYGYAYNQQAT